MSMAGDFLMGLIGLAPKVPRPLTPDHARIWNRMKRAAAKAEELTVKHEALEYHLGFNDVGVTVQVTCHVGDDSTLIFRRCIYFAEIEKVKDICPIMDCMERLTNQITAWLDKNMKE